MFKDVKKQDIEIFINKFQEQNNTNDAEKVFMRHLINSGVEKFSTPYYLSWELTGACNLRCKHCCFAKGSYDSKFDVNKSNAIKFAKELVENDIIKVMITGGEPLLRNDLLDIISVFKSKNTIIELTSNATLIDEKFAKKLSNLFNPKTDYVQVSLDGADSEIHEKTRGKNSFNKAINGIKILIKNGINVTVNCVITQMNIHQMIELYNLVEKLGVKLITYSRIHSTDENLVPDKKVLFEKTIELLKHETQNLKINLRLFNMPELATNETFVKSLEYNGSKILNFSCHKNEKLHIRNDGEVFLCLYSSTNNILPIGNISKDSLGQIIENTQKNPLFQDRMLKNTKCNKCSVQYYCKGGCPAKSYQENKDINFSDSSCTI